VALWVKMPSLLVALRASFFFAFSFAWAGAINVLPQLWLLHRFPERRHFLLSLLLLGGTGCAVIGVLASQRQLDRGRPVGRWGVVVGTAGWLVPLGVMLSANGLAAYVTAYLLFRFTSNWIFNHLDHHAVRLAGPSHAAAHVTSALAMQLLGMMVAPAFFAFTDGRMELQVSVMGLLGVITVVPVLRAPRVTQVLPVTAGAVPAPPRGGVVRFHLCTFMALAGVYAFATQLIYLLRDLYRVPDAERLGGLLLGLLGLVGMTTAAATGRLLAQRRTDREPTAVLAGSSLVFAAGIALFAWPASTATAWLLVPCGLAGGAYGAFLAASRLFATRHAAGGASTLSLYNNMPNLAALGAYSVTALLSVATEHDPHTFSMSLLAVLASGFLVAATAWAWPARAKNQVA
jgi:hypothetical protein